MNFWETVLANTLGGVFSFLVIGLVGLILKGKIKDYINEVDIFYKDMAILLFQAIIITIVILAIGTVMIFVLWYMWNNYQSIFYN